MTTSQPAAITRRGRAQFNLSGMGPGKKIITPPPSPLETSPSGGRPSRKANTMNHLQNSLYLHERRKLAKDDPFALKNCHFGAVYCRFGGLLELKYAPARLERSNVPQALRGNFPQRYSVDILQRRHSTNRRAPKAGAPQGRLKGGTNPCSTFSSFSPSTFSHPSSQAIVTSTSAPPSPCSTCFWAGLSSAGSSPSSGPSPLRLPGPTTNALPTRRTTVNAGKAIYLHPFLIPRA